MAYLDSESGRWLHRKGVMTVPYSPDPLVKCQKCSYITTEAGCFLGPDNELRCPECNYEGLDDYDEDET